MAKKNEDVREKTLVKELMFKLTPEEVSEKAQLHLEKYNEVKKVENDIKEYRKKKMKTVKETLTEMVKLNEQIQEGTEARSVRCNARFDYKRSKVEYWYKGELIEKRDMEEWERQDELFEGGEAELTASVGEIAKNGARVQ